MKTEFKWLPVTTMPDGSDLRLPLHVIHGARPGPTLGLTGMIHGNELVPAVLSIRKILELLDPADLSGTVMAVPVCNPLGAGVLNRNAPTDGANVNAVFWEPGHGKYTEPVKTVSEQIANVLSQQVLAHLDYHIDFHSGGGHSVHMIEFTKEPISRDMARAFNSPILLFDEWRLGQMWRESERLGTKAAIVAECGGDIGMANEWIERTVRGTFNVMRKLGMLPGAVEKPPRQYLVRGDGGHEQNANILRPREGGIILPNPAITPRTVFDGQPVEGVPVLGQLLNFYDFTVRQKFESPFKRTLLIAAVTEPSWLVPGSYAYILFDADNAEVLD